MKTYRFDLTVLGKVYTKGCTSRRAAENSLALVWNDLPEIYRLYIVHRWKPSPDVNDK